MGRDYVSEARDEWEEISARLASNSGPETRKKAREMVQKMRKQGLPDDFVFKCEVVALERKIAPGPNYDSRKGDSTKLAETTIALRAKMLRLLDQKP